MRSLLPPVLALLLCGPAFAQGDSPDFARDVFPLFQKACVECHGPEKQKGGLRLDSTAAFAKGGDSGTLVDRANPGASKLLKRVTLAKDTEGVMPPRGDTLTATQIAMLKAWIAAGAKWTDTTDAKHWAYVKPTRPQLPTNAHPVDAFIHARLQNEGLAFSPEASREILIRRVSFDLVGLPPTPAEVDAFVKDTSPDAYEKLVDRLLASKDFGVRWARPWLDYARYADSHGFQRDDLRDLWAYRDWVVDAINADMPYDRFTIEQIAGDLLPNATLAQKIATGFNRSAPTNVEAGTDPEETRVNQVHDRVNTLGMIWLGSTLECAQCHDHKYDPISQKDYYGLFAFFNNTALEADRTSPKVPGSIRFIGPTMPLNGATVAVKALPKKKAQAEKKAASEKPAAMTTLIMQEIEKPRPAMVFKRGDFRTPGDAVQPGTPRVLHPLSGEVKAPTRLDLANWLISPENPLAARVAVNRFWAELFGDGLVTTLEDFGVKGERPTHPELLDWLACEFMQPTAAKAAPWSTKHILRTIVLSRTYRQSSRATPELLAKDDRNRLYARGPRVRLDAEAIRDNALAIAGLLSTKQGGPPIYPYQPDGLWAKVGGEKYNYTVSPGDEKYRRGLYVVWKRGAPYPSFINFDATARMACRVQRPRSNTPLQALTLMNDPVYVEAALAFAKRVIVENPTASIEDRLRFAFRAAVSRSPRPEEIALLRTLFEEQQMTGNAAAAKSLTGSFEIPKGTSATDFAAWYSVCAALLNLDETITKG